MTDAPRSCFDRPAFTSRVVPVIVLTAYAGRYTEADAHAVGAAHFVTKPIDLRANLPVCNGKVVYPATVRLYWQLQRLETTLDASSDLGRIQGEVVGQKYLTELSHRPDGFSAYFSVDGKSFCKVGLLEPVQPCDRLDRAVLAFRNDSGQRINVVHYGLFF